MIKASKYFGTALNGISIIAISKLGWRAAYTGFGFIGVLAGLLMLFTVEEPGRCALDPDSCPVEVAAYASGDDAEKPEPAEGNPIKLVLKNPVALSCIIGSAFRYVGFYTLYYFYPAFMLMAYPGRKTQYAMFHGLASLTCGFFSAVSGGVLAEKIGHKDPRNYARICLAGALLTWPCVVGRTLITNNFGLAIAALFGSYIFGENFWSPNL